MISRLVTGPTAEPVTLAEAKAHLRIEHALDDAYITSLIKAARYHAEDYCWRAFMRQTWEVILDGFPDSGVLELPRGQLNSITSVTYLDADGVEQTLPTTEYVADTFSERGRVRLGYSKSWPTWRGQWDAVRVRYEVGGDAAGVPAPVKQAVLLLVSQMYENRTPDVVGTIVTPLTFAIESLLGPYRLTRF